jgi:hypothetical protein
MIRTPQVAALVISVCLLSSPATADPVSISVATAGGVTLFSSTVVSAPGVPTVSYVSLSETWTGADPIVLRFAGFAPGSYLDITTETFNLTGETWTSWSSRTAAVEADALPPVHVMFEASKEGFFTMMASWVGVDDELFARCATTYAAHECVPPFYGNLLTAFNGSVAPGETLRLRYVLRLDRGDFSLTQTPNAPVPEPGTLLLFGTGAAAVALRRRRRSA